MSDIKCTPGPGILCPACNPPDPEISAPMSKPKMTSACFGDPDHECEACRYETKPKDDIRPPKTVEVTCKCGWSFWLQWDDPKVLGGPHECPSCVEKRTGVPAKKAEG